MLIVISTVFMQQRKDSSVPSKSANTRGRAQEVGDFLEKITGEGT